MPCRTDAPVKPSPIVSTHGGQAMPGADASRFRRSIPFSLPLNRTRSDAVATCAQSGIRTKKLTAATRNKEAEYDLWGTRNGSRLISPATGLGRGANGWAANFYQF